MCPGTVWFGWVWVRVRVWESNKQKKWSKVYSFCFSFWVLSCSILVEKFLKKKGRKIEILKRGFFDQNSGKSIRWKVSGNCTTTWNPQVCEGLSIWDIKISGIYNSKLVKNFLIKCVRELFDLVEFGVGWRLEYLRY